MLLPVQIVPFLQHPDKYVRTLAVRYFWKCHDPSPVTADDLWKMIDAHGPGQYRTETYAALSELPHSEKSLRKTLDALASEKDDEDRSQLAEAIGNLPYGFLARFNDVIESSDALPDWLTEHLAQRFELAPLSPAELWDRLVAHCAALDDGMATVDFERAERTGDNLIEALARNPEAGQWAVAALNERKQFTSLHVGSVKLLGRMRYRPAAELLYRLLDTEYSDLDGASVTKALVRVGTAEVVRLAHENFAKVSWGARLLTSDVLRGIKLSPSESALTDLLTKENDLPLRTQLADAVCQIAATEPRALERLREIMNKAEWDLTLLDLDADVVALFTMVGFNIPELPKWRAALEDEKTRKKAIRKAHQQWMNRAVKASAIRRSVFAERPQKEMDLAWDLDSEPAAPDPDVVSTIRRSAAKVGRNDLCPCGSGKKFKKCCGK